MCRKIILSTGVCLAAFSMLQAGRLTSFHDFAHVGDGGGIATIFLITNQGSEGANLAISFFKEDGSELSLTIGETTDSRFVFEVPSRGMLKIETTGTSETVQNGWARLEADRPVGAQVLFEIRNQGNLVTQAAVESSGGALYANLFVDHSIASRTSVAVANNSTSDSIRVVLVIRNEAGETVANAERILSPRGKLVGNLSELFDDLESVRGTLTIAASGRFAVIALQQTGLVIGSLAPIL